MTVSERDRARVPAGIGRVATFVLALVVAACFTGESKDSTAPTGVIGPTGTGGHSGSGGGPADQGTYHLRDINDSTLPVLLANDSASGTGSNGDTIRVFRASIDSSVINLNSDSSAEQRDYLTIFDSRTATDSSFSRNISFGDTTFGTFSTTSTTVTVSLIDTVGGTHAITTTYNVSGTTLTGTVLYQLFSTDGELAAAGEAAYQYDRTGGPLHSVLDVAPDGRAALSAAARPAAVRVWRVPAWVRARLRIQSAPARTRP